MIMFCRSIVMTTAVVFSLVICASDHESGRIAPIGSMCVNQNSEFTLMLNVRNILSSSSNTRTYRFVLSMFIYPTRTTCVFSSKVKRRVYPRVTHALITGQLKRNALVKKPG